EPAAAGAGRRRLGRGAPDGGDRGARSVMAFALPHDASADGFRIDRLIALGAEVQIPLLLALGLWLVVAALRWGRRHPARGLDRPHSRLALAISLVALGTLAAQDAVSWAESNRDLDQHFWNFSAVESDPRTVRIEVDAHQWAWAARYAGPDRAFNTP